MFKTFRMCKFYAARRFVLYVFMKTYAFDGTFFKKMFPYKKRFVGAHNETNPCAHVGAHRKVNRYIDIGIYIFGVRRFAQIVCVWNLHLTRILSKSIIWRTRTRAWGPCGRVHANSGIRTAYHFMLMMMAGRRRRRLSIIQRTEYIQLCCT